MPVAKPRLTSPVLAALGLFTCAILPSPLSAQLTPSDSTAIAIAAARFYLMGASRTADSSGVPIRMLVAYRGVVIPPDSLRSLSDPRVARQRPGFHPFITPPEAERCLKETESPEERLDCARERGVALYLYIDDSCREVPGRIPCGGGRDSATVTVWTYTKVPSATPGAGLKGYAEGATIRVIRRGTHWAGVRLLAISVT